MLEGSKQDKRERRPAVDTQTLAHESAMQGAAAAQLAQRSASPNQLMRPPNSEQPPPKHAAKAEYSRREQ